MLVARDGDDRVMRTAAFTEMSQAADFYAFLKSVELTRYS